MTTQTSGAPPVLEPGSFRDREGRVYYRPDGVYRGLSARALAEFERLSGTKFWQRLQDSGKVVRTERVDDPELTEEWVAALRHERIPFVSYPYEWCFGMLRDAARLQLEVLDAALAEDTTLKDATPYNVQWVGARPTFIDVPSFIELQAGEPWVGYSQFCSLFLFPLLLQAHKGVDFHPWLRGNIDGIDAQAINALMSWRDRLRPGVLLHVTLQAMMLRRHADTQKDVKAELKKAGFKKELIQNNVRGLTKLVGRLDWAPGGSTWAGYAENNTYDVENRAQKEAFVGAAVGERHRSLVWDLGCNTGDYSRIASEHADHVVAMDADHLAVERLYRALAKEKNEKVLPLVVNLADSSPNLGWRGKERKALPERGRPDMTLALALIHHVVIAANVPLEEFLDWLAELGTDLVIEFVTKDDAMVKTLLRNKEDQYHEYEHGNFERLLAERFEPVRSEVLQGGTRIIHHARAKGS